MKIYYAENKSQILERTNEYRKQNKEQYVKYQQAYRDKPGNAEKILNMAREWRKNNPEKVKNYKEQNAAKRANTRKKWLKIALQAAK